MMLCKVWLPLPLLLLLAHPVRPAPSQSGVGQSIARKPLRADEAIYESLFVRREPMPRPVVIAMLDYFKPFFELPQYAELHAYPVLKKLPRLLESSMAICEKPTEVDKFSVALSITKTEYENLYRVLLDALDMHRRDCERVWLDKFADYKLMNLKGWHYMVDLYYLNQQTSHSPPATYGTRVAVMLLERRVAHSCEEQNQMVAKAYEVWAEAKSACSYFMSYVGPYIAAAQKLADESTDFYNNKLKFWVDYLEASRVATPSDFDKALQIVTNQQVRPS